MKRLRLPLGDLEAGERSLPAEAARYVARVHRLAAGDGLLVFDPAARLEAEAEVLEVGREVTLRLAEPRPARHVAERAVTLIQAIGKGTKLDAVVRDATELGATRVVPVLAARSVKRGADVARLTRVAVEAARQCGRGDIPTIATPCPLLEALAAAEPGQRLLLHPSGEAPLVVAPEGAVTFAVGPEGGFAHDELDAARAEGFAIVRLGRFVLRTETAATAALARAL